LLTKDRAMTQPWQHIDVDQRGDVACVRLRRFRIEESEILELTNELMKLAATPVCKKIALSLGPRPPECLYSVFLAKLMTLQRRLADMGCTLLLCEVSPEVQAIFQVCHFAEYFHFVPDFDAAVV
jgi:hypothetical protein